LIHVESGRLNQMYISFCQRAIEHNNGKIIAKNGTTGLIIEITFPKDVFI